MTAGSPCRDDQHQVSGFCLGLVTHAYAVLLLGAVFLCLLGTVLVQSHKIAFSVALTNNRWCLGPEREETTVVYQHVFINLGGSYNVTTGKFIAPYSGVYSFSLTVYSDAGAPDSALAACASLHVNGSQVASASDQNRQDQEDSSTTVVALRLNAGDKVHVKLPAGCFLCDNNSHYNTFTGFLLYPLLNK
uniref:Cerebellin 20 n=1 Tax=Myripristis murdjan TaxID=586833 RepID=A0A667Y927_9TELE